MKQIKDTKNVRYSIFTDYKTILGRCQLFPTWSINSKRISTKISASYYINTDKLFQKVNWKGLWYTHSEEKEQIGRLILPVSRVTIKP